MPHDEALVCQEIGWHAAGSERDFNLARANDIFSRLGVGPGTG